MYEPSLWYYHEMTFLDVLNDPDSTETDVETSVLSVETTNDGNDDDDEVSKHLCLH